MQPCVVIKGYLSYHKHRNELFGVEQQQKDVSIKVSPTTTYKS